MSEKDSEIDVESFWIGTYFDTSEGDMLTYKHIDLHIKDGEYVGAKLGDRELSAEQTKMLVDLIF